MGNNTSRKLCIEYNERVNLADAKRRLGQSYKMELTSIIIKYEIFEIYKGFNIVELTLKDYPDEKFYIFVKKADWNTQKKDFIKIYEDETPTNIHVYLKDSDIPKYYFVLAIIKPKIKFILEEI